MKTILVVGASGFVGSNLVLNLRKRHKVIAGFNKHVIPFSGVSPVMYRLSDRDYMKRMVTMMKPNVIIYCAGINDFMECAKKPQIADAVNSLGPVALSAAGDTVPHRLIYISTSYVYDGKRGNFSESDVIFPETILGKGKIAGENYVRSKSLEHTIFRFSPILGYGSSYHLSEFDKIRMKLERGEKVELSDKEIQSFTTTDTVFAAVEWAVSEQAGNATFNLGGLTKLSWYEMGLMLAERWGFDKSLIIPGRGQFDGEIDFSLNGSEFVRQSKINPLVLEEGLDLLQQQLIR